MKKYKMLVLAGIWICAVAAASQWDVLSLDAAGIERLLEASRKYAYLLFCLLFVMRLLFLIPSSAFIVAGAVLFSPVESVLLSSLCMLMTSTIVYTIGRQFTDTRLHRFIREKHPDLYEKLQTDKRYLFFTVLMPIAPTDAACFVAGAIHMKYRPFLTAIFAGAVPFTTLYTIFGRALSESPGAAVIIAAVILLIVIIEVQIRKKLREKELHL
ncbi:TVP38/TMEM64 family protein [Ectobacillus ponti]|uniref:TVP38/TMEM64 family membrane protein n=1 Tax=Ectobacillus ponti TaxID=2961894 RepID=A0AA41X1X1_9BACI|nr:VTT domain-containing protein [Ectobacillus ponti]MCP8967237.1 VTT domain-containing protein [Ectobacillus ponti]